MAQRKTKSPVHAGDGHTCGERPSWRTKGGNNETRGTGAGA